MLHSIALSFVLLLSFTSSDIKLPSDPDYVLDAMELSKEWKENKAATKRRYLDKIIEVHGVFRSTEPVMFSEDVAINLKGVTQDQDIYVFDLKKEEVANLKEGDSVKIIGTFTEGFIQVEIGEASILK